MEPRFNPGRRAHGRAGDATSAPASTVDFPVRAPFSAAGPSKP
jgi:hypothetical protein